VILLSEARVEHGCRGKSGHNAVIAHSEAEARERDLEPTSVLPLTYSPAMQVVTVRTVGNTGPCQHGFRPGAPD